MPPVQRGQAYRLAPGKWGLRYYDADGVRRRRSAFPTNSAALAHYRDHIEPALRGEPAPMPELTLAEFVELYLVRHGAGVRTRTIDTLRERERVRHAVAAYGDVQLRELERMTDELAGWRARQPERVRHARMSALRQTLAAAVRWGHIGSNPAAADRNPKPPPRGVRASTRAELDAIAAELAPEWAPLPAFAAATGLRPEEWQALERRDVDRRAGVLTVRRTVSSGEIVELAKTARSRRQVPLSPRALSALDTVPARLNTPLAWPAARGGVLNLDNWRRRVWAPAIEAAGVPRPARIYDLRSTFASNAVAAGIDTFELAHEHRDDRAPLRHAAVRRGAGIVQRLAAFEAAQDNAKVNEQR